jgi:Predicted solute binding protein
MHYNFAIKWLYAFREASETVCALYDDGGFVFEDVMLDQHNIDNKPDLLRLFAPYANKDPDNGIGIHNFRVRSYIGDERSGLIRWEWQPEHAAIFLGLDVAGKPFGTQGHTFHLYGDNGLIRRESSWWDAGAILRAVGPVSPDKVVTAPKVGGRPSRVTSSSVPRRARSSSPSSGATPSDVTPTPCAASTPTSSPSSARWWTTTWTTPSSTPTC